MAFCAHPLHFSGNIDVYGREASAAAFGSNVLRNGETVKARHGYVPKLGPHSKLTNIIEALRDMGTMAETRDPKTGSGKSPQARVLECTRAEFNSVFMGRTRVLWRRGTAAWRGVREGDPLVLRVRLGEGCVDLRAWAVAARHYGWVAGEDGVSPVRKFLAAEGPEPLWASLGGELPEAAICDVARQSLDPVELRADGLVALELRFGLSSASGAGLR